MHFQLPALSFVLAITLASVTALGLSGASHPVDRHRAIRNRVSSQSNKFLHRRQAGGKGSYCSAKAAANANNSTLTTTTDSSSATPTPTSTSTTSTSTTSRDAAVATPNAQAASTTTTTAATTTTADADAGSSLPSGAEWTQTYSGDVTYYATGLGACGWVNTDSDLIAAVAEGLFDSFAVGIPGAVVNPNKNPMCGHHALATLPGIGSVTVKLVDRCTGCVQGALDFSPAAYNIITNNNPANNASIIHGRFTGMHWVFVD